jgi:hypothetical protein
MAASLASAPELQKNTLSAKLSSVSRAANSSPGAVRNRLDVCRMPDCVASMMACVTPASP